MLAIIAPVCELRQNTLNLSEHAVRTRLLHPGGSTTTGAVAIALAGSMLWRL